ncbi:MAG: hypothetical protein CR971_02085 [candidate division SR1 bacterium]|nr:MAG: hypothetical protein CR971_02085 [candidate division SR1 bacterium]
MQDKDSKTSTDKGIKSIKVSKTKVSITLYGPDGSKPNTTKTTTITYTLKRLKEKVDNPTTYAFATPYPKGITVDKEQKTINYPWEMTQETLQKWLEKGTAQDADGEAKFVIFLKKDTANIILSGKNGKTKQIDKVTISWRLNRLADTREIVVEEQKIPDQKLTLGDNTSPVDLYAGLKTIEESELVIQKILCEGKELSVENAHNYVFVYPGNYRVIFQAKHGDKEKTITRTFQVESAEKQKIMNYPEGSMAEVSRRYAERPEYNDGIGDLDKKEKRLEVVGEARATAQTEYVFDHGTREHSANRRQEKIREWTLFLPDNVFSGNGHGAEMKEEILTKNRLISEYGDFGMKFEEFDTTDHGDREGLKKKLEGMLKEIQGDQNKYYLINASRGENDYFTTSTMEGSVLKNIFKQLLATDRVIIYTAAGNTAKYSDPALGGVDVLALEGDSVGHNTGDGWREPNWPGEKNEDRQGTRTCVPASFRDWRTIRRTALGLAPGTTLGFKHTNGSVKVKGGDSFSSRGSVNNGTSTASSHESGEFVSIWTGATLKKGEKVHAMDIAKFMREKRNFEQGVPGNSETRLLNKGNMIFDQMLEVPQHISIGDKNAKILLKARVDNVYVTVLGHGGKAIKLLKNSSGKFVENQEDKTLDYVLSVEDLIKLGYKPGSILKLQYSCMSDRIPNKSIENRTLNIKIVQ